MRALQLGDGFEVGVASHLASFPERRDGPPRGVILVRALHLVRLVGVIVGVHRHRHVFLLAQRRRVSDEPKHNLAVDETQRVHHPNRRARRRVRVARRQPQLQVIPALIPQILRRHAMRHDRHQSPRGVRGHHQPHAAVERGDSKRSRAFTPVRPRRGIVHRLEEPVRGGGVPPVAHALDVAVAVEIREGVLEPRHVRVREQHGTPALDEFLDDAEFLRADLVRPLGVVAHAVRRDASRAEFRVQRVVQRDDDEIFHAEANDAVHELEDAGGLAVRDGGEYLAIDGDGAEDVAQRLVALAVHGPLGVGGVRHEVERARREAGGDGLRLTSREHLERVGVGQVQGRRGVEVERRRRRFGRRGVGCEDRVRAAVGRVDDEDVVARDGEVGGDGGVLGGERATLPRVVREATGGVGVVVRGEGVGVVGRREPIAEPGDERERRADRHARDRGTPDARTRHHRARRSRGETRTTISVASRRTGSPRTSPPNRWWTRTPRTRDARARS